MIESIQIWLESQGIAESAAYPLSWIAIIIGILILALLSNIIAKRILLTIVNIAVKRSRTSWDDVLAERKVFTRLSHIAPALVIYAISDLLPGIETFVEQASMAYMILVGLGVWNGFLSSVVDIYQSYDVSRERPIKGYVQVLKIISFIFIGVIVLSTLFGQSPWLLLSGMGAMSAVLLLIFKDSILGLVAGIQLSGNNMIRRGDWIEMPKFGADGDVIDVSLNTVKVQNWDKTIVTIPTYALISDSFKNWRGMEESGGRRIKRAITIDVSSVGFCNEEMMGRFEKFELIRDYIVDKKKEIGEYNRQHGVDTSTLVNGRNMTNIGIFRAYLAAYLKNHPKIHDNMTFIIRHLPLTEKGLPIEIYVFSNDQAWANYEGIQADIFDHILAVVPMFNLRVFQNPTGNDLQALTKMHAG